MLTEQANEKPIFFLLNYNGRQSPKHSTPLNHHNNIVTNQENQF